VSDILFEGVRILDPSRGVDEIGSVLVRRGRIAAAGAAALNQGRPEGAEVVDCAGKAIMPGLVDACVFVGEPGAEHRETMASAAEAAAAGGVTSLIMMPDVDPVIDDIALVEFVLRAGSNLPARIFPAAALTKALQGREMTEFGLLKQAGAVAFSEGRGAIASSLLMRRALTYARDFDVVVAVQPRDAELEAGGVMNEGLYATWLGLAGIPREAESIPLERDLALARLTGGRYHAASVSTALSVEALRRAKDDHAAVSAAVSINNLTLNENDVGEYRTFFKLSPPLRSEDDRQSMIEALRDGTVDMIVSSHDPQDVDTKRLPFAEAAAGAIGLETLLSAALRLHHSGDVPLPRLVEALSAAPARRFGLPGGTLKPGASADLILVDLDEPWIVREDGIRSRSKNTCFEGARMQGRVRRTLLGGRTVFTG
jgi:dihydroorotase